MLGNDASDDSTLEYLNKYKIDNAKIYSFTNEETGLFGKQKVLRKLVEKSKGDYLLFTDADMTFHPKWVRDMLYVQQQKPMLSVGLTRVSGNNLFERLQNLDWQINQYYVAWMSSKNSL